MIRAFLGIDLPPALRGALQVQQFLLPLPRKVAPETLHLTLVFLGDCPEPALEAAHEGFQTLRAHSFVLSLQGLGLFGKDRPRAAWAGVAASPDLLHLQARADAIARRSGRGSAFLWASPVRVGPEAVRLSAEARGNEGATGLSSPKRYLWDERPTAQVWRFNGVAADGVVDGSEETPS